MSSKFNEVTTESTFFEKAQSRISQYSYLKQETRLIPVIIVGNVVTRILEDLFGTLFPSNLYTQLIIWFLLFVGLWFFYWMISDLTSTFQTQPFKNEKLRKRLIELGWLQPETVTITTQSKKQENVTLDVLKDPEQDKAHKTQLGRETQAWIYWIKIIDWLQTIKIVVLGFVVNGAIGVILQIINPSQWYYKAVVWILLFVISVLFVNFLNLLLNAYEYVFVEPLRSSLRKFFVNRKSEPTIKSKLKNSASYSQADYSSD